MSKKSKRARAKFRYIANTQVREIKRDVEPVKIVRPSLQTQAITATSLFEQYKYIRSELLRIGIIAGAFFIILIILSFFI
jgi:hypothetical protein